MYYDVAAGPCLHLFRHQRPLLPLSLHDPPRPSPSTPTPPTAMQKSPFPGQFSPFDNAQRRHILLTNDSNSEMAFASCCTILVHSGRSLIRAVNLPPACVTVCTRRYAAAAADCKDRRRRRCPRKSVRFSGLLLLTKVHRRMRRPKCSSASGVQRQKPSLEASGQSEHVAQRRSGKSTHAL